MDTEAGDDSTAVSSGGSTAAPFHLMLALMRTFVAAVQERKLVVGPDSREDLVLLLLGITRQEWRSKMDERDLETKSDHPAAMAFEGLAALCEDTAGPQLLPHHPTIRTLLISEQHPFLNRQPAANGHVFEWPVVSSEWPVGIITYRMHV
jgi:hypothetical protein